MSDNEWQQKKMSGYFRYFFREESTNRYCKENPFNLEEDIEEDLLN